MNVLCIDNDGVGLSFCWRCVLAGHKVRWYVKPKPCNNKQTGDGFGIEKIGNWVSSVMWADLVFATTNDDYMERLDSLKSRAKIFAPSKKSADLEVKRADGMKFLESHGIDVPSYKTFPSLKEAESYVQKKPGRYVFKTLGDHEDKSLSYCSKDPADMVARLQRWQQMNMNPKGEVMLQEFIPGIEIGVSRWMGSKGWVGPPNENFEFKKLMAGDIGPNTGEMGTVMKYTGESKLFDEVLKPMTEGIRKLGHLGDIDINCIVDEKGKAWPLEFTSRPGWPAFNIMMSEHKGDPAKWMLDAINGKDTLQVTDEVAIGVVIAQPDFPYGKMKEEEKAGMPIYGVTEKNQKYIHPQAVKMDKLPDMEGDKVVEKTMWATAGDYLAVVTGMGKTIKQAQKRVYKTVDDICVANMLYRSDIGDRLQESLVELHKHGFGVSFEFGA